MSDWVKQKTRQEKTNFINKSIKLSEMVENNKLSSTAAKTIFSELYNAHKLNLHYINEIDGIFND